MKHLTLLAILSLSLALNTAHADRHESQTVQRSFTGGSAGADAIAIAKSDTTTDTSARARLNMQDAAKNAEEKKLPRTVQRSLSGGAGSADRIVIEKH